MVTTAQSSMIDRWRCREPGQFLVRALTKGFSGKGLCNALTLRTARKTGCLGHTNVVQMMLKWHWNSTRIVLIWRHIIKICVLHSAQSLRVYEDVEATSLEQVFGFYYAKSIKTRFKTVQTCIKTVQTCDKNGSNV